MNDAQLWREVNKQAKHNPALKAELEKLTALKKKIAEVRKAVRKAGAK